MDNQYGNGLEVTAGNVLLLNEPPKANTVGSFEAVNARRANHDTAIVVKVGKEDGFFPIDPCIKPGARFIVPQVQKQIIDWSDGRQYIVVHYRHLKVLDTTQYE